MAKKSNTPTTSSKKPNKGVPFKRRTRMIALEPRMLFDGALGVDLGAKGTAMLRGDTTFDAGDAAPTPAAPEPQRTEGGEKPAEKAAEKPVEALEKLPGAERKELVFIDGDVEDYQQLIEGVNPNAKVVVLDSTKDGIKQILEHLAGEQGVDAIHIVSHGTRGNMELGSSSVNVFSMATTYAADLAEIGKSLSADADILVYGCDFGGGSIGRAATTELALLTGADVAASQDLTGHDDLKGNWVLERSVGNIETSVAFNAQVQQSFHHVMSTLDWDAALAAEGKVSRDGRITDHA